MVFFLCVPDDLPQGLSSAKRCQYRENQNIGWADARTIFEGSELCRCKRGSYIRRKQAQSGRSIIRRIIIIVVCVCESVCVYTKSCATLPRNRCLQLSLFASSENRAAHSQSRVAFLSPFRLSCLLSLTLSISKPSRPPHSFPHRYSHQLGASFQYLRPRLLTFVTYRDPHHRQ
jgi:hypothetical protein